MSISKSYRNNFISYIKKNMNMAIIVLKSHLMLWLSFVMNDSIFLKPFLSELECLIVEFQLNSTFHSLMGFLIEFKHHFCKIFLVQCLTPKEVGTAYRDPMGSMWEPLKLSLWDNLLLSVTCVLITHVFMTGIVLCQKNIKLKL